MRLGIAALIILATTTGSFAHTGKDAWRPTSCPLRVQYLENELKIMRRNIELVEGSVGRVETLQEISFKATLILDGTVYMRSLIQRVQWWRVHDCETFD